MKKIFLLFLFYYLCQNIWADETNKKSEPKKNISFDKATIKIFKSIPILSDGRVKPLDTYASFVLLRINGRRVVRDSILIDEATKEPIPIRDLLVNDKRYSKNSSDKKMQPMEWFLTVLFYPEIAAKQRIFLVDNSEILGNFGAENIEARDRYSFAELEPLIQKIFKRAGEIEEKDKETHTLLEQQTLRLGFNLLEYMRITQTLDFARPLQAEKFLSLDLNKPSRFVIAEMLQIQKRFSEIDEVKELSEENHKLFKEEIDEISMKALEKIHQSNWLTIFPPLDPKEKVWLSPYELYLHSISKEDGNDSATIFSAFEETCMAISSQKETPENFKKLADSLHQKIYIRPAASDYLNRIKAENLYYNSDIIYKSLIVFIAVFLSVCLSFINPGAKKWHTINTRLLYIPICSLTIAIILRCFILSRPPIATLYETILFITAAICIVCIMMEVIYKNRIITFVSSIVGISGLFLSFAYEKGDGTDTMGNLAAVLNSNFWLSTHVTTVTIGYSAGLLASIIAHIYIVAKVLRLTTDQEFYKNLNKMMYGILCFCTLFATVGTILGGIWANYSWGRFWGWDPKENGALAIVLWNLIILHGRISGIFKEFGIAIMCVFGGMVVVASWWGVNQLGVGLHSYGFTTGIVKNLAIFAILELSLIAIGLFHHYVIEKPKTTH